MLSDAFNALYRICWFYSSISCLAHRKSVFPCLSSITKASLGWNKSYGLFLCDQARSSLLRPLRNCWSRVDESYGEFNYILNHSLFRMAPKEIFSFPQIYKQSIRSNLIVNAHSKTEPGFFCLKQKKTRKAKVRDTSCIIGRWTKQETLKYVRFL